MLVIKRKINQAVKIGPDTEVKILKVQNRTVTLGIGAPSNVLILRTEVENRDLEGSGK